VLEDQDRTGGKGKVSDRGTVTTHDSKGEDIRRDEALTPERVATLAREAAAEFRRRYAESGRPSMEAVDALAALLLRGGDPEVAEAAVGPLFTEVVEPLADSYDGGDRMAMVTVLARLLARTPGLALRRDVAESDRARAARFGERLRTFGLATEENLIERVKRVAGPKPCRLRPDRVRRVVLLSRITIGADVLLNGLALAKLGRVFPGAERVLIGPAKNALLFAGADRFRGREVSYPRRGRLFDRFFAWLDVLDAVEQERGAAGGDVVVVNLDSRLLQSGLLPVLDSDLETDRYFLWEPTARTDRGDRPHWSLAGALARWLQATFGPDPERRPTYPEVHLDEPERIFAKAVYRTLGHDARPATVTVNLGVGGNPRKRVAGADPPSPGTTPSRFERRLILGLLAAGHDVVLDKGFERDEVELVTALAATARTAGHPVREIDEEADPTELPRLERTAPPTLVTFQGSVTRLAALIGESDLYVGYDSVGPHLAGALGRDLIAVFAGYDDPWFPDRWRSAGPGIRDVLRAGPGPFSEAEQEAIAVRVLGRVGTILGGSGQGSGMRDEG